MFSKYYLLIIIIINWRLEGQAGINYAKSFGEKHSKKREQHVQRQESSVCYKMYQNVFWNYTSEGEEEDVPGIKVSSD